MMEEVKAGDAIEIDIDQIKNSEMSLSINTEGFMDIEWQVSVDKKGVQNLYPLYHRGCGGQVAWFTVKPEPGILFTKDHYRSLNGKAHKANEIVKEICPKCGKTASLNDMAINAGDE